MKSLYFPIKLFTSLTLVCAPTLCVLLIAASTLRAQTNFDFNNATDDGWVHWVPEFYSVDDGFGNFTNASILPTVTFTTNDISAGNMAYFLHAGTTNGSALSPPRVGTFFTNGPSLTNLTMTGEFFHWTNGQGQEFGIAARVQLPLPPDNAPNQESSTNSYAPSSIILVYANARSAKNFNSSHPSGSTDNLRIYFVSATNTLAQITSASFSGPGANYTAGQSLSPDAANGRYRLIFTVNDSGDITGQIVDLGTGLPMRMGSSNLLSRNMFVANTNLAAVTNIGGAYGFVSLLGSSGGSLPVAGNNTVGQPLDPKFDNFAIVPGVVTLQSAAAVDGPYAWDPTAGIEVFPKRITVPVNGDTRFYRISWFGADHTPSITSIAPGPTVNVVTASGATTTVTNAVNTIVLTYN